MRKEVRREVLQIKSSSFVYSVDLGAFRVEETGQGKNDLRCYHHNESTNSLLPTGSCSLFRAETQAARLHSFSASY